MNKTIEDILNASDEEISLMYKEHFNRCVDEGLTSLGISTDVFKDVDKWESGELGENEDHIHSKGMPEKLKILLGKI